MALPTDIFIHTNDREEALQLTGATWMRGKWRRPAGTYRDGENFPLGKANIKASGSATLGEATDVPVFGKADIGTTFLNAANALAVPVADEVLNIPPRQKWEIVSGYVVAIEGASLPTLPVLPAPNQTNLGRLLPTTVAITTVNATTNRFFATDHNFVTGDKVIVGGTSNPGGTTTVDYYGILRLSAGAFMLTNWLTGAIIDLSSIGSAVEVTLVTPAPRMVPASKVVRPDLSAETVEDVATILGGVYPIDNFISNDIVTVKGTLPTGLSLNTRYRLSALGLSLYQFVNLSTDAVIALSGSTADFTIVMDTPAAQVANPEYEVINVDGIPGLLTFEDELSPKISNVA